MSDSIYNNYRAQKALKCKSQISTFQIVNLYSYKFFFFEKLFRNWFSISYVNYSLVFRSSCSQMSFKIGVLKNPAKSIRKHLCQSLQLYQKETPTQVFSVNIAKFLRTTFLQYTSGGCFLVLLSVSLIVQDSLDKINFNPFHASVPFLYPFKTRGFLFSGGMEMKHWREMS